MFLLVTVKIVTKTYEYNHKDDTVELVNEEVSYIKCGNIEALNLIVETNSQTCEDDSYFVFKSENRRLTTSYAELI